MRVVEVAQRARLSTSGEAVARFGLASRSIVYATLSILVLELALGRRSQDTDQSSGIRVLGDSSAGRVLLVLLVAGVLSYVVWRWTVAAFGIGSGSDRRRGRWLAFAEGLGYVPFGYMSLAVLLGDRAAADQSGTYRGLSGEVMRHMFGRAAVGVAGLVVITIGFFLATQGIRRTFLGHMDLDGTPEPVRRAVTALGVVGATGRGVIFTLAGVLVCYAAITADPDKAAGLDAALDSLLEQPLGSWILILAAVCFASFAVFTVAEARWRRT